MREKPDMAPDLYGVANQVVTVHPPLPCRRPQRRRNHPEECALSAAVMSHDANDFARFELERHAAKRPPGSEPAGKTLKRQSRRW